MIYEDEIEPELCDICNEHAPLTSVVFRDNTGLWEQKMELKVCESCKKELLMYDVVIHDVDSSFGTKFADIRGEHGMHFESMKEIAERSTWGELEDTSNGKRIIKRAEWGALKKAAD